MGLTYEEKDVELVERIKAEFPKQFAEFNRLKKRKMKWETEKLDDRLHWLQMEMVYRRKWIWEGIPEGCLGGFSTAERKIISDIANKYYEEMEKRLWTGKDEYPDRDQLHQLITDGGVDIHERSDEIFFDTYNSVHISTRVFSLINSWTQLWKDWQEDFPDQLQY